MKDKKESNFRIKIKTIKDKGTSWRVGYSVETTPLRSPLFSTALSTISDCVFSQFRSYLLTDTVSVTHSHSHADSHGQTVTVTLSFSLSARALTSSPKRSVCRWSLSGLLGEQLNKTTAHPDRPDPVFIVHLKFYSPCSTSAQNMPQCAVWNCASLPGKIDEEGKKLSFHAFPLKDATRLKAWIHASGRKDFIPTKADRVCSLHFNPDDFERDLQLELMGQDPKQRKRATKLKPGTVPQLPKDHPGAIRTGTESRREQSIKRAERAAHKEVGNLAKVMKMKKLM